MRNDFAIFIPSYDRCKTLLNGTLHMLKKYNYTGKWYVVIDDNDPQLDTYKEKISEEHLLIFHKPDYYDYYDTCYNKKDINSKLYALGFINDVINNSNINYYYIIDDDFEYIKYNKKIVEKLNYDELIDLFISLIDIDNIDLIGFCNFPYGEENSFDNIISGNYFLKKDNNLKWLCNFNEEVGTSLCNIDLGKLVYSIYLNNPRIYYKQEKQWSISTKKGGNSKLYRFFTNNEMNNDDLKNSYIFIVYMLKIMINPNSVPYEKVVDTDYYTYIHRYGIHPKIIDGRWKK